jgi:hypothetical protein
MTVVGVREAPTQPIGEVRWRRSVRVRGAITTMRVRPWAEGTSSLECTLVDDTGGITLVFLGRRRIAGIELGRGLTAEGMVSENRGRLVILNPLYTLHVQRP